MRSAFSLSVTSLLFLLLVCINLALGGAAIVAGYTRDVPPETPAARALRHERVAQRRAWHHPAGTPRGLHPCDREHSRSLRGRDGLRC